jgi:hypothetical protein
MVLGVNVPIVTPSTIKIACVGKLSFCDLGTTNIHFMFTGFGKTNCPNCVGPLLQQSKLVLVFSNNCWGSQLVLPA